MDGYGLCEEYLSEVYTYFTVYNSTKVSLSPPSSSSLVPPCGSHLCPLTCKFVNWSAKRRVGRRRTLRVSSVSYPLSAICFLIYNVVSHVNVLSLVGPSCFPVKALALGSLCPNGLWPTAGGGLVAGRRMNLTNGSQIWPRRLQN